MSTPIRVIHEEQIEAPEPDWEALFECLGKEMGLELRPLTLVFISSQKSRELNRRYRGKDVSTNILSFEKSREILIDPFIVQREAKEHGISFSDWMTRLVVHGILHLEGFTHEEDGEAESMERLEKRILGALGISVL